MLVPTTIPQPVSPVPVIVPLAAHSQPIPQKLLSALGSSSSAENFDLNTFSSDESNSQAQQGKMGRQQSSSPHPLPPSLPTHPASGDAPVSPHLTKLSKTTPQITRDGDDNDDDHSSFTANMNPEINLLGYMYGPNTLTLTIHEHLDPMHWDSLQCWCQKHNRENQTKYGQHEAKEVREAAAKAAALHTMTTIGKKSELSRSPFDPTAFRVALIHFIIADDQSLNVIECCEFCDLLLLLCEDLQDIHIPKQMKPHKLTISAWKSYFKLLGCHDGKALAKVTLDMLNHSSATLKIGHWTLDNAENNDTFMDELGKLLKQCNIPFDHKDQ
ncbi:hypothetical protein EDD16DRAFT_1517780 [Pisolithus croceorrhizus]|nr:hypothetical protein EDD16DRAFT_1517780 [Pisolithus croceorrhizus]KAI6133989.1 hypothetical protein EV401DRAFT_1883149 [Pisolithus croceorrhizus]KAI6137605.1 hypothetical protein EDD17DRAFT_1517180 [Pisolithus thermaeus]